MAQRERPGGMGIGTPFWLHGDHLGSASLTTTTSGAKQNGQEYGPWGAQRSGDLPETTVDFTGQRRDDTGLLYYGARYYDPLLGRFLSADSIGVSKGDPQTLNRYSYVRNNPVNRVDPTGHQDMDPFAAFRAGSFFNQRPLPGGAVPLQRYTLPNGYQYAVSYANPGPQSAAVGRDIQGLNPNIYLDLSINVFDPADPAWSLQIQLDVLNTGTAVFTEIKSDDRSKYPDYAGQIAQARVNSAAYLGGVCPVEVCGNTLPLTPSYPPQYSGVAYDSRYFNRSGIPFVNYYSYYYNPVTTPLIPGLVVYNTQNREYPRVPAPPGLPPPAERTRQCRFQTTSTGGAVIVCD